MPIKQLVRVAFKAIRTNKSRSFLTALGVIIGVASVILLISVGSGLKSYIAEQMQDIGSNLIMVVPGEIDLKQLASNGRGANSGAAGVAFSSVTSSKLKLDDLKLIEKIPQIEGSAAIVNASSPVRYKGEAKIVQVIGTTEDFVNIRKLDFEKGSFFTGTEVNSGRKVAVLGYKVAEDLFGEDDPVSKKIKLGDFYYQVMGVIEETGGQGSLTSDDKVFVPITTAQRQFNQDNVSLIFAQVNSNEEVSSTIPLVDETLKRRLSKKDFTVIYQK